LLNTGADIINYIGAPEAFKSGNAVEIFWLLLSPIFVNRRFFWVVSLGLLMRYLAVGVVIHSKIVLFPMLMIFVLSIFAYILLSRFQSYVKAVKISYDQQLEGIVKGVIATLELKDNYTRGHSERVGNYASMLAVSVKKFSESELKSFNYACLLHDIGKINIPDQILLKPSKLTDREFEIIKKHPVVGAEAVKNVAGLNNNINVIRSHHERWDGKGYPDQLAGEEIPLLARVTSIADAFDAMTSSRSYRAALPVQEAYQRIIQGKGSQFDPMLVEAFKQVFPAWVEFHNKYPWSKEQDEIWEVK
jgi:putative nucleotidyltransferase with HDIG domain